MTSPSEIQRTLSGLNPATGGRAIQNLQMEGGDWSALLGNTTNAASSLGSSSRLSSGAYERFLMQVMKLLQESQSLGTRTFEEQALGLQEEQVGRTMAPATPGMSPQQQSAIRSADVSAVSPSIEGVNQRKTTFAEQLANFGTAAERAIALGGFLNQKTTQDRQEARDIVLKLSAEDLATLDDKTLSDLSKKADIPKDIIKLMGEKEVKKAPETMETDQGIKMWDENTGTWKDTGFTKTKESTTPQLSVDTLQSTISSIDTLLQDVTIDNVVNKGWGTKLLPLAWERMGFKEKNFIASVDQMISQGTLQALISAKARGATFGALSDAELEILGNSFSKIKTWEMTDDNGKVLGYSIDKDSFENELKIIKESTQKLINSMFSGNTTQNMSQTGGTTVMTAPDGSKWNVPNDKINIFKQNGYK